MAGKSRHKQCRKKRRFWQVHLQAWKKSGLIQAEYCRQHDLRVNRFIYWKRKIASKSTPSAKEECLFAAVPAVVATGAQHLDDQQSDSGVEIQLGNLTITLTDNFNTDVLVRVVHTLGGKP